jgi:hypothetical protein
MIVSAANDSRLAKRGLPVDYAHAIRIFDEDGNQVGAATVDELPDRDKPLKFEGKTYKWHARLDQWREDKKSKSED